MSKICYESVKFQSKTLKIIEQANEIIEEYSDQGFDLTLRQLFYQFVSRDLIPNTQTEYSRLGTIISKGRRAGLIDWDAIVDRTRSLKGWSSYENPRELIEECSYAFKRDLWQGQDCYIEIWFEKDALMGVFQRAAYTYRIPFFSCRGYASDSEIHVAARRLENQNYPIILHFGDHDPSGIDMTRDIQERLELFGAYVDVKRLALNFDQIAKYNPPPNPAKETDSRFEDYQRKYGDKSWELDALDPTTLSELVTKEVENWIDLDKWNKQRELEEQQILELKRISNNYDKIVKNL